MQEDENIQEDAINYFSRSLVDDDLSYAHVEKLALVVVHIAQRI